MVAVAGLGGFFSSLFGGGKSGGVGQDPASFGVYHSGGVVGSAPAYRTVSPSIFTGPRFHSGLSTGEFPAILQHGERVLTQAQSARTEATIAGLAVAAGAQRSEDQKIEQHYHLAGRSRRTMLQIS